jgi:hypothetical protein
MCSAYVHATGCEPELTNHATTRYQSLPPKTFTDSAPAPALTLRQILG